MESDPEAFREDRGVLVAHRGRVARGHGDRGHLAGAECARREHRGERRVDAARQTEHRGPEAGLSRVVADPQRQRGGQLGAASVREVQLVRRHDGQCAGVGFGREDAAASGIRLLATERRRAPGCRGGRRLGRQLGEDEPLLEPGRLDHDLSASRDSQRSPVEHQRVVPAHQVAQRDRHSVAPRRGRHHVAPDVRLPQRVGRCREVHQELRALPGQLLRRVARVARLLPEELVVPEVLADGEADPHPRHLDDGHLRRRIEVPRLVEDVVGRQQGLAPERGDLPVAQQGAGVE